MRQTDTARRAGQPRPWLVFGAATLIALVLYLPTLKYDFVWDDRMLILNNPSLGQANPIELFTTSYSNNQQVRPGPDSADLSYYRPLANLSVYVDRKVWGLRPAGYHLTNVVINATVVFLMCLLLWELFGSVWLAGLGGWLTGIHPAMNCIVTFVSNRTYLLALLFLLLGSYALLRGQRDRRRVWPVLFGGSLLFSALALEASLVFPVVAAGWLVANRTRYHRFWTWVAAAASPVLVYLLLRLGFARVPFESSVVRWAFAEPLRVIDAFGQQLQLLFFPFNQKVVYAPTRSSTRLSLYTILGLLFLFLPLYALIRPRRSNGQRGAAGSGPRPRPSVRPDPAATRLGWFGYAWVVLVMLPFAHLVFLGPAGRILYLAAPGACILLAALSRAGSRQGQDSRVAYAVILLYTVLFAAQTLHRNPIWHDELSLTHAMAVEAPGSTEGHFNYGLALGKAGRTEEAIEQFRAALATNPDFFAAHVYLASALVGQGDLAAAIQEQRTVVRLLPGSAKSWNDLAATLIYAGQFDSAIVECKEALRRDPNSASALNNLGYAYLKTGDLPQAVAAFEAALRLNPNLASARANLATAYRAAGMPDSAARLEGTQR
ncbi:MAG TPA: tetratricopeptide repeat protein [bacterium]|nr:tetratricopeptide repeat protein [bacterium]